MSEHRGASLPRGEHEVFDELAVGWALHALEPEDESLFAAHLPTCPRCRRTVAETSEVMGAMASDLAPVEPPQRLRDRLRAAVAETAQVPRPADEPARPVRPVPAGNGGGRRSDRVVAELGDYRAPGFPDPAEPPSSWRRVLPNALVAAAVAAILALGTWNVVLSSARDEAQATVAEQQELVNALLTPGRATIAALSGDDGSAVVTVVARDGQVQVVTHGLRPNNTRDRTYVVWGIGEGAPDPLGTFDVTSPQMALQTVGSASSGTATYNGYAVSLEPGRQAPQVPTDVVAQGEVTS